MARNTESIIILLDVSKNIWSNLPQVKEIVREQITQRLLFNHKDEVAIITFGCDETKNELQEEIGGYENVSVQRSLLKVDIDAFKVIDSIFEGHASADFVNAIVVAMDMMVKQKGTMKRGLKKILLIAAAASPLQPPAEGFTQEDQIDAVADRMREQGVVVDALLVRPKGSQGSESGLLHAKPEASERSALVEENKAHLRRFAGRTGGEVEEVERWEERMNKLRPRVAATTSYRGDIEVTPFMSIKVHIYKKTLRQRFPSLPMYSEKAPAGDATASRQVKLEREYKLASNPDADVPPDQRVKAFRYGQQIVPISDLDRETHIFRAEKGIKVMGFTLRSNVPRHYFMKEASVVLPEPGDEKSSAAVSALVQAMEASGKVAIVRAKLIARADLGVSVGVLTPNASRHSGLVDSFFLNILPFAEDIREFTFPSFDNGPKEKQPSKRQLAAAHRLLRAMSLEHSDHYLPEKTSNPVLQRYYKFVHAKFKDPEASVPDLTPEMKQILEPPLTKMPDAIPALRHFQEAFPLVPTVKRGKSDRKFWSDRLAEMQPAPSHPPADILDESEASADMPLEALANQGPPSHVGRLTPVQDFERMMAKAESEEVVRKAILGIQKMIEDFLDASYNGNLYGKAMDCLKALRKGCVVQEEPVKFNDFLRTIATKCKGRRLDDFWQMVVSESVSLIHRTETERSKISEDESKQFLLDDQESQGVSGVEDEEDEMEELLGGIE